MLLKIEQKILLEKAIKFHNHGNFEKAIKLYSKLIKKDKKNLQLLFLIGTANIQLGKNIIGIEFLKKFLDINPNNSPALINIGNAFKNLKKYYESITYYNKAIKLDPRSSDAYSNRGTAELNLNSFEEALLSFDNAIKINPKHFFAYNNKGIALLKLNRFKESIFNFDKAIQINPNYIEAYNSRGSAYKNIKIYDKALSDYERVFELNPNYDFILGKIVHSKMFLCDWKNFDAIIEKINYGLTKRLKVIDPFSYLGIVDNPTHAKLASEIFVESNFPNNQNVQLLLNNKNKKIKIAYFSADFHDHPVLHLMMDVFKNHNKEKFDIHAFSMGPDKNDKWRNEVKNYINQFRDISKVSDLEVINLVRSLKIDIAIDLSGYTGGNNRSIFANRVAPIQISYLGFPGTTALQNMDYIIADETIIPKKKIKYYSEKVIYLPNCYQANMNQREISDKNLSRDQFGLPKDSFIYCCFNNSYKITPHIFSSWLKILNEVENSVLWILKTNDVAADNLKKEAKKAGVDPKRVIFAEKLTNKEHLKRISLADLFLDTFPYNAHTTASDTVRMGVPIITLIGNSFSSRVAASILKNLNMNNLIVEKFEDYEKIAIELGTNIDKFKVTKKLFKNAVSKSQLFDSLKFTEDLENLYSKLI